MARGFLAGIFWGGVVGVGMLGVSSQTLDRQQLSFPKPQASAVEVPGGSEFDQAREETDPVLPGTEGAPEGDAVVEVTPPDDAVETPPALDTASLDAPQPSVDASALAEAPTLSENVDAPSGVGTDGSDALAAAPTTLTEPDTPVATPDADTVSPEVGAAPESGTLEVVESGAETAPEAATDISSLPDEGTGTAPEASESTPVVVSDSSAPASPVSPEISEAPSLPGVRTPGAEDAPSEEVAVLQPETVAPETPLAVETTETSPTPEPDMTIVIESDEPATEIVIEEDAVTPEVVETPDSGGVATVDGSDSQFFTPVESLEDQAENVEVNRLPGSGSDTDSLPVVRRLPGTPVTEEDAEPAPAVTEDPMVVKDGPAIRSYAMEYDSGTANAIVSLVLLHEGAEPLSGSELDRLPATVSLAVNAGAPNAPAIASAYRQAGREVVLIPSLPTGATPQDVEVALSVNLEQIPEAVAVMDVSGSSFQSDRQAVAQVVEVVKDTGHGLITFPRGLNTAHQQAERAGLPTGLIFRVLDQDGESNDQIRRTLDRAAFRARQSDAVILVGHTRADTIAAVSDWASELGNDVSVAPVSAALAGE